MATIALHTLATADGSATYTSPQKFNTVIAGVNYPVEVPYRSDEIPESTFIEVNLRPHNGVGMVKERHVEELIRRTLSAIVLGEDTPRTMLQVTLQVTDVAVDETLPGGVKGGGQGESYLVTLASALNASVLGCLDAGVHMKGIAGATIIAIFRDGTIIPWPSIMERKKSQSMHVFCYNSQEECILMESEGRFQLQQWEEAEATARRIVVGSPAEHNVSNGVLKQESMFDMTRRAVEARFAKDR